jgi:hypothetical protein
VRHSVMADDSVWRGTLVLALIVLGCPHQPPAAQEVYKSVDAQGHVVYSDRGANKGAAKTDVRVDEPDPTEVARLAKQQDALKAQDLERQKQQAAADKAKEATDKKKEQVCTSARNQYQRLQTSRRIYQQRDADGNAVYYSDEAADAMREQARKAMAAACGS